MGTSNTHPGRDEMNSSVLDPLEALFSAREREITGRKQRDLATLKALAAAGTSVGLFSLALYAAQFGSWLLFARVFSGGLLTCAAAALLGVVVGFLFGLPRPIVLEPGEVSERASPEAGVRPRPALTTNLEQISDISGKLLIGLLLTQLYRVPELMSRLSDWMGRNAPAYPEFGKVAIGAMAYASCLGFLSGYLWTRLVLSPAFRRVDEQLQTSLERLTLAERKVRDAAARVEELDRAAKEKSAAAEQAINTRTATAERTAERILAQAQAAAAAAAQAQNQRTEALQEALRRMLHALHSGSGGFERALAIADAYTAKHGAPSCALFYVRQAAAHGRRATEQPESYDEARGPALAAVRRALEHSPELGRYWLSAWFHPEHPHAIPREDWLQVFFDDPEFQETIGKDPYLLPEGEEPAATQG